MESIYFNEIKRSFNTLGMGLALIIGSALSLWHVISVIIPTRKWLVSTLVSMTPDPLYIPTGLYNNWMGNEMFSIQSYVFFLIIPLLSVLPFGVSFYEDLETGYIINVCTRINKMVYYRAKYLAVFLSGGTVVAFPLLLNLILSSMFLPAFLPDNGSGGTVFTTTMAYSIYYTHPLIYVCVFIVINFLFAGVMATLSLSYTYITERRLGVMIAPFVLYFFIYSLANLLNKTEYSLFFMLNGGAQNNSLIVYILYFLLFFVLSYVIFMWMGKRQNDKK